MPEILFEETCKARDEFYSSIGNVEPDVIAHIINPSFMGGPSWPALRQAFSIIHRDNSTIVISNGLSDPFDDHEEENTGFEIEIYAETKEKIEGSISDSSLFKLVYATAQQVACSGQIADFVKQYDVITMELYAEDCGLHDYQNDNGMVGIMIGIEHPEIPKTADFPGGEIVVAMVQVLTPDELNYVAEARAEGRNNLHKKFKESNSHFYVSSLRKSLIETENTHLESNINYESLTDSKSLKPWWKLW